MRLSRQPKSLSISPRRPRRVSDIALRRAITPFGEALSTLPWLEGLAMLAFLMLAIG